MSVPEDTGSPTDDFYAQLLTRSKAQRVLIGAPENDPIARVMQALADRILQYIGSTIRDTELALLLQPDRVIVRTIPPAGIEALTVWISPRHAVAVNAGLAIFLYRLARAFSAHVIVRGPTDPAAPPESQAVGIIASLLDWMSSPVRAPLVENWPVGLREQRTAENYTQAAERFVVAHEIGHILHRHVIADSAQVDIGRASPIDLDTRPVEQEVIADQTGAILSIESAMKEGFDPGYAVVGIHFFFQALGLGEKVGAVHVDDTHPPAEERLALCRWAIDERYGANFGQPAAQQTDELLGRLGTAALEERERRRKVVAARMDELLRTTVWRRHGRDRARDRVREPALLDVALSLMSQSPSAVVEALAANILETQAFEQLIKAAPSAEALEASDRWRRHQIAHFIARHSPLQVRQALGVVSVSVQ